MFIKREWWQEASDKGVFFKFFCARDSSGKPTAAWQVCWSEDLKRIARPAGMRPNKKSGRKKAAGGSQIKKSPHCCRDFNFQFHKENSQKPGMYNVKQTMYNVQVKSFLNTQYAILNTLYFKDPTISSGLTQRSNCSAVTYPNSMAAAFKVFPSLCAFFAISAHL